MLVSDVHYPKDLAEALDIMRRRPGILVFAGGTDILREQGGRGISLPPDVLYIRDLPELKRAGLTERTFFRHFADKREVLFQGAASLQELLVNAVAGTPASSAPIDAIAAALAAAGAVLGERRESARQRQTVIAANPELRERELIKLASLATALANALRARGVRDPTAGLAAEAGIAVFKIAFERWVEESNQRDLPLLMRESLDELRAVSAGG